MTRHEKIIGKIAELTKAKYPDAEVYLYGSQARGDNSYLSDWDLLILIVFLLKRKQKSLIRFMK